VPGTGLEPASREAADFRHTASFDVAETSASAFVRWTMPSPSRRMSLAHTRRIRRPPSSLYTFREMAVRDGPDFRAWLGVASACSSCLRSNKGARGFAEFEGFCTDRFRPGTQLLKSAMFTNFITRAGRTRFYHWSPASRAATAHPRPHPVLAPAVRRTVLAYSRVHSKR